MKKEIGLTVGIFLLNVSPSIAQEYRCSDEISTYSLTASVSPERYHKGNAQKLINCLRSAAGYRGEDAAKLIAPAGGGSLIPITVRGNSPANTFYEVDSLKKYLSRISPKQREQLSFALRERESAFMPTGPLVAPLESEKFLQEYKDFRIQISPGQ